MNTDVTVLIPTYKRLTPLAVTLTSLLYQEEKYFRVCISDQSAGPSLQAHPSMQTIVRAFQLRGNDICMLENLPPRGMAQQRQFLLDACTTRYALFLDDDVLLEPWVIRNLKRVLQQQGCGFAGSAVIGLSYRNDRRDHEQQIERWTSRVEPECILPKTAAWRRYMLHNAANLLHVQEKLGADPDHPIAYKVAWVGGCVLYDSDKLQRAGGFSFWQQLPPVHCGEDVLAQLRVMKRFGGCGVLPSGVYHQELETTLPDRSVNAPEVLDI